VVGDTRLVRFGFGKTATLLVRGGGGDERSSWSCPVSELLMFGVSSFSFSREPPWSVNTSLQSFWRSHDFSPLRRRFVLLVLDLVVLRGCWLFLRLVV
jgi:hypothetical protein